MHLISRHRRGCDCFNDTPPTEDGPKSVCAGECDGKNGHCVYVVYPECHYWSAEAEKYATPCMYLRKKCVAERPEPPSWIGIWKVIDGRHDYPIEYDLPPVENPDKCIVRKMGVAPPCPLCPDAHGFVVKITDTTTNTYYTICLHGVPAGSCSQYDPPTCLYASEVTITYGIGTICIYGDPPAGELKFPDYQQGLTVLFDNACEGVVDAVPVEPSLAHLRVTISPARFAVCDDGEFGWNQYWCCSQAAQTWQEPDCQDCFTKWTLQPDASGCYATLTGETTNGLRIVFEREHWDRNARQTFTIVSRDEGLEGFPTCVCVAPMDIGYRSLPCQEDHQDAVCKCCIDFGCGAYLDVSVCGTVARRLYPDFVDNLTPWPGVDYPPWVCGGFVATMELPENTSCPDSEWGTKLLFLMWCDGNEDGWHVWIYCWNQTLKLWVFQEDAIDSAECHCQGILIEGSFKNTACICCCPDPANPPDFVIMEVSIGTLCGCEDTYFVQEVLRLEDNKYFASVGNLCGTPIDLEFTFNDPCENSSLRFTVGECTDVLQPTQCQCNAWLFVTPDLIMCDGINFGGAGPCFVSILVST